MIPGNPLSNLATAASVVRLAGSAIGKVAQGVSQIRLPGSETGAASTFANVFANDRQTPGPESAPLDSAASASVLGDAISEKLRLSGIEVNPEMNLVVNQDGTVEVQSGHPRAAEIEAFLSEDPDIAKLASTFGQHLPLPIVLTATQANTNIPWRSGG
jgi:hypothetical protein